MEFWESSRWHYLHVVTGARHRDENGFDKTSLSLVERYHVTWILACDYWIVITWPSYLLSSDWWRTITWPFSRWDDRNWLTHTSKRAASMWLSIQFSSDYHPPGFMMIYWDWFSWHTNFTLNQHFPERCTVHRKPMSRADYIFALLFSLKTIHDMWVILIKILVLQNLVHFNITTWTRYDCHYCYHYHYHFTLDQ